MIQFWSSAFLGVIPARAVVRAIMTLSRSLQKRAYATNVVALTSPAVRMIMLRQWQNAWNRIMHKLLPCCLIMTSKVRSHRSTAWKPWMRCSARFALFCLNLLLRSLDLSNRSRFAALKADSCYCARRLQITQFYG